MNLDESTSSRTRASLLVRLQQTPDDRAAWAQFVDRYGPQVFAWCRRWGLQEADAADVTQMVLMQLTQKLRDFRYDPAKRFRAWIKTLTQHAWSDFHRARKRGPAGSGDTAMQDALEQVEARDDLEGRLQTAFDQELLEMAIAQVKERVEEHTWQAYWLTATEGLSGAEAAQRLKMQVGTVFKAKSKVQRLLQEVVRALENEP